MKKKAIVNSSGGMDSSICLALAIGEFGKEAVLSLSFDYEQRHAPELVQSAKIARDWNVDHQVLKLPFLKQITSNALIDPTATIESQKDRMPPNTLVVGRNGLMAHLGAIYAHQLGAHYLYMGVLELEEANSGYRDCSRAYMDLKEKLLKIDLEDPLFEIRTPLVKMTKKETLELAHRLGILDYLLLETITCYNGIPYFGCSTCPSCELRNAGLQQFVEKYPNYKLPYPNGGVKK